MTSQMAPGGAAYELRLFVRRGVEVHPAQRPGPSVARQVALRPGRRQARGGELAIAVGAGEKPAVIGVRLQLDDHGARQAVVSRNFTAAEHNRAAQLVGWAGIN